MQLSVLLCVDVHVGGRVRQSGCGSLLLSARGCVDGGLRVRL